MGEMEISASTRLSPKEPFETEMGRQRHQQNLSLQLPVSSPTSSLHGSLSLQAPGTLLLLPGTGVGRQGGDW